MAKPNHSQPSRLTVPGFVSLKQKGRKICVLTAYDYPTARLLDSAGVDVMLVGDSLAMVIQGLDTTLPVTLDEMIYHGKMVVRGSRGAMVIVDLPFPTFHLGVHKAIELAGRVMKETHCQAVKLEGGQQQQEVIAGLVSAGIPVMAHVGLRPQSVHTMGGYKIQRNREQLLVDARAAEQAGAFGIVLECIPRDVAGDITAQLTIPTIGIGAGPDCDGQVLVIHDLLGMTTGPVPTFVKPYANLAEVIGTAVDDWCTDVRKGQYPDDAHSFE
jgi:3-methyl-2-oxobutanoate hydroxymethyltransferase